MDQPAESSVPAVTKADWRSRIQTLRSSLDAAQKAKWDQSLAARLDALAPIQQARCVLVYLPHRGEAGSDDWIAHLLDRKVYVCAPVILRAAGAMSVCRLTALTDVRAGRYGLRQPLGPAVCPRELDVIIVPGVAFTARGARLGMGGGYYDRFLPQCRSDAVRIALAYDFQIAADLPCTPLDEGVDVVVTPTQVLTVPVRPRFS